MWQCDTSVLKPYRGKLYEKNKITVLKEYFLKRYRYTQLWTRKIKYIYDITFFIQVHGFHLRSNDVL